MEKEQRLPIIISEIAAIGGFITWINFAVLRSSAGLTVIFLNPYFPLFIIGTVCFIYFRIGIWKNKITRASDAVYEVVRYRKMTPVSSLALLFGVNKDDIYWILYDLINSGKIHGYLKKGIFYNEFVDDPICPLCGEEILNRIRLIVCPFCRKPFHKDHLLGYIERNTECPACGHNLTLGDLYGSEED